MFSTFLYTYYMAKSRGPSKGRAAGDAGAMKGGSLKGLNALKKKTRSPTSKWQIDYDYLEKLNPNELKWLNDFTDEHYLNRPLSKLKLYSNDEKIRERWRAYMQNRGDVIARRQAAPRGDAEVEKALNRNRQFNLEESMVEWLDAGGSATSEEVEEELLAWYTDGEVQ